MATLPDIDTSTVSFLAYWNATNHGVSSIAPSETTSASNLVSYTAYDNGIEGKYKITTVSSNGVDASRNVTVRVKNDGWFVAYLDQSANYTGWTKETDTSLSHGPWDIMQWGRTVGNLGANNNLANAIQSLQAELSNSGSITYNNSDVGLFNYEYQDASATTMTGAYNTDSMQTRTMGWQYTDDTTLYAVDLVGIANSYSYADDFVGNRIDTDGGSSGFGTRDALGNNDVPNAGTEYTADARAKNTSATDYAAVAAVTVWG